jgi:hypothetical protein
MRFPYAVGHAYCLVSTTAGLVFQTNPSTVLKYIGIKSETKIAVQGMESRFWVGSRGNA